ncbi:MAG: FHA domain-containing protein [Synechococcales cyanobacterium RM1_1_8]|nr:FHA domain-containing protein [Synechococcales cyanobacterium RM1_1_8]
MGNQPPSPNPNSPNPKGPKPQTLLGSLTQLVKQARTQMALSQAELRQNVRVPEVEIENIEQQGSPRKYPLVGDRYLVGRSSSACDIAVPSPIVSQVHVSLNRSRRKGTGFTIKDEGSTNGFYWKKKRYDRLELRHNDVISLGPPELTNAVTLRYFDPPPWYQRLFQGVVYGGLGMVLLGAGAIALEWRNVSVKQLGTVQGPIAAYAGDGTPLQTLRSTSHRELDKLSDFSPYLPKAVVASEDSRYYWHVGFDPLRVASALLINLRSGSIREGASTLTQQIARSLYPEYVGTEDSASRKIKEILVAMKLETFYSKDFLLKTYLNRVYLGVGYGFEDAAQKYFNKSATDLTLSESATLVGILPAPNAFSPCDDIETATGLRNRVLSRMVELNMVSAAEGTAARRSPIVVDPEVCTTTNTILSPYFYGQILNELDSLLGSATAREGNFIIETELDLRLQELAESSLRNVVGDDGSRYGFSQGAVVTIDANSGAILALVGGINYQESQFNRAIQALRQPGSTFKLFTYAAALDQGISPNQTFSCAPLSWEGQSYSGCERSSGNIDLFRGLAQSENAIALRLAQEVGLEAVARTAQNLGITSSLNPVPGMVLGQSEVTPLEMTAAYAAIANGGERKRPHAITRIFDSGQCSNPNDYKTCRLVYDFNQNPGRSQQALPREVADSLTQMLQRAVAGGTGREAAIAGQGVAGKTGTTNDGVDLWFIGYLPNQKLVTGIWLGNDDNSPTSGSSGNAAYLWGDYMGQALQSEG